VVVRQGAVYVSDAEVVPVGDGLCRQTSFLDECGYLENRDTRSFDPRLSAHHAFVPDYLTRLLFHWFTIQDDE